MVKPVHILVTVFTCALSVTSHAAPSASCVQTVTGIYGNTKACFENRGLTQEELSWLCESKEKPLPKALGTMSSSYSKTSCPSGYKGACMNLTLGVPSKKYNLYHYENEMDIVRQGCLQSESTGAKWMGVNESVK